jgi:hypothetical protein
MASSAGYKDAAHPFSDPKEAHKDKLDDVEPDDSGVEVPEVMTNPPVDGVKPKKHGRSSQVTRKQSRGVVLSELDGSQQNAKDAAKATPSQRISRRFKKMPAHLQSTIANMNEFDAAVSQKEQVIQAKRELRKKMAKVGGK